MLACIILCYRIIVALMPKLSGIIINYVAGILYSCLSGVGMCGGCKAMGVLSPKQ